MPAKGVSLATLSNWGSTFLITFLFPIVYDWLGGIWQIFAFFSFICLFAAFYIYFNVKETQGKSAREIEKIFLPKNYLDSLDQLIDKGDEIESEDNLNENF